MDKKKSTAALGSISAPQAGVIARVIAAAPIILRMWVDPSAGTGMWGDSAPRQGRGLGAGSTRLQPALAVVPRRVVPAAGMVFRPAVAVRQFVPFHTWYIKPRHIAFTTFDGRASPDTITRSVINRPFTGTA